MDRIVLKSKIHRAVVTEADVDYEGSIGIDSSLLKLADIRPYEQVHVYNVTNGERFVTYAIEEKAKSGKIIVNGAAARLVYPGDLVIIASYVNMNDQEFDKFQPKVVLVDKQNRPLK